MQVTHEEMKAARVPLLFRDYCAHLLIPLNECRVKTWYSPFKCTDLRHEYEKCQFDEYAHVCHRTHHQHWRKRVLTAHVFAATAQVHTASGNRAGGEGGRRR